MLRRFIDLPDWLIVGWEYFYSFVTLLSLGLSLPAMAIAALVIFGWHKEFVLYKQTKNPTSEQRLIAGIYRGFVGSLIDNAWWFFAWTFDYLDMEFWRNVFFAYGVFCNVIFRQGALIWAGYLHIEAENMSKKTRKAIKKARRRSKMVIIQSIVMAFIFVAFLFLIKHR